MNPTFTDDALWSLSVAGQIVLFLVLVQRRFYRNFPVFIGYLLYSSSADVLVGFIVHRYGMSSERYFIAYFANSAAEFLLQLGILLEVGWQVLSPVKRSLPKSFPFVLLAIGVIGALAVFALSVYSKPATLGRLGVFFIDLTYDFAYARLVIFSAIVFFAQLFGIGWRNHVLQITTGFIAYSIVILTVELGHRFLGVSNDYQYHHLEQFRIVGWLFTLGYWIFTLVHKEAPRKAFSPKMVDFLVSISGTVREDRETAVRAIRK